MPRPRVLALAGSARKDSFNKQLLRAAVSAVSDAGAEVTHLDLRDLPMPLFDQDLEAADGLPENARKLKALMLEHQGLLIACPEYNSSITPLLKNVIDWASRSEGDEPPLACYKNKVAALMSASPGALGGLRGLYHVRDILANIGVLVVPQLVTLAKAHEAFEAGGGLRSADIHRRIEAQAHSLVECLRPAHS